ncbi:MAG: class II glutamine amidotransferase [Kiloniellales bacterium]|nr:class II glutamine amidotransferase [Kiloniellales bacterium]
MCRLLVYRGREILMSDLLTRTEQSLIRQSYKAMEREEPLNGDGFGVGWYDREIDATPCVFTSVRPAWSNRNLHRLAEKVRSTCFFAHVRAASSGMSVSEANCHPFQYGRFLWMHNGRIEDFNRIKRTLRQDLADEYYNFIQGTTDSEHIFALFLNNLGSRINDYSGNDLADAIDVTIKQLNEWAAHVGLEERCFFNFALTDGDYVVITRYTTRTDAKPETLYVTRGSRFERVGNTYRMSRDDERPEALIVASEPLTTDRSDWESVPRNHALVIDKNLTIEARSIDS